MSLRRLTIAFATLTYFLTLSCSATDGSVFGQGPPTDDDASSGAGAFGGSTGSFTPGTSSGGGNPGCDNECSPDLHSVVDCNGKLVEECPADQGCGENGCVPACESAKVNKSTIGCDYYAVVPDAIGAAQGGCFATFIANTWGSPVQITVERAGVSYDVASFARIPSGSGQSLTYAPLPGGELPPNQVAILFLARFGFALNDCPAGITPAFTTQNAAVSGTGRGNAFHIETSRPVVTYDIYPYGGGSSAATSATLLLPTTAWGDNYISVNAFEKSVAVPEAQPSLDIVAAENGTEVTINPIVPIVGGVGVSAAAQNTPTTYTLNKGEILQFTQDAELTGSPIQSNKPIGMWGTATCLSVGVTQTACDAAHQQIPPINALGSEYVAVRYRNRFSGIEETPPWRFVGAVDGTTLTYEPAAPPGAPTSLNLGQVAKFNAAGPFVVRSQDDDHPFYVAAYMTGCNEVSTGGDCRGDPEFVNVVPPEQYLRRYTFFTDPTYPETNLVLIRRKYDGDFSDVTLDCAGVVSGWQNLDSAGDYQYTHIDLVTGNFQPVGGCDNGLHVIESDAPFGLAVWGWGSAAAALFSQAVSYAYPAGASIQPINQVVVPPIPK